MTFDNSSHLKTNTKSFLVALLIFTGIIVLTILLAWMFNPPALLFSENFNNNEKTTQQSYCTFREERGRYIIVVAQSHSICAVLLPRTYDNFTLNMSFYTMQNAHDDSLNLSFRQNDNGEYKIQLRPKEQLINYVTLVKGINQESYMVTMGWVEFQGTVFDKAENKIKLTATRNVIDFWLNDVPIFKAVTESQFDYTSGTITLGIETGEGSDSTFEFDNIEIYSERLYSRWRHDLLVIEKIKNLWK
jgi:hypothetical protein